MKTSGNVRPWVVLIKGIALFALINYTFALPVFRNIYRLSFYNTIVPGKMGFGGAADLDIMMMTNRVSSKKAPNEFRVFVSGDSSVAGAGLQPDERFVYLLNQQGLRSCDGRRMVFYNLGSPFKSLLKDLLILDRTAEYQPDLIVHFLTLETLLPGNQFAPIVVKRNPSAVKNLVEKYHVDLGVYPKKDIRFLKVTDDLSTHTLWAERGKLFSWVEENLGVVLYMADVSGPEMEPEEERVKGAGGDDLSFAGWEPGNFRQESLRMDLLKNIRDMAGDVSILVVNEPILIFIGDKNSDVRYNANYPRWAYDDYRAYLAGELSAVHQDYLDLWDAVPMAEFTNSSLHRTPAGEKIVVDRLIDPILQLSCGTKQ